MSGPSQWLRRTLSPIERSLLIDMTEAPITRERVASMPSVDTIALMCLIGMDLVTAGRRWWIFGPVGFKLTRKGREWAGHLSGHASEWGD